MTDGYLYDTDEVQRLIVEYGLAESPGEKQRIEGQIIEATVGTVYPDDAPPETGFPSGAPLLAALIRLHRETDDDDVVELIEREVEVAEAGLDEVKQFDSRPLPYASYHDLMDYHDSFEGHDASMRRYLRLRVCEELGAFDEKGMLRHREANGLTDEEREYLTEM
ncbi:hypothetical protein SAMN04487949_1494 [Halogranum gelatinilyticum]|uniref:Uncharacterized protein n=1 Tax=Halogranum gelatinilyticum TaxID=660521 RepID=A0A1G9STU3_9EURY|nr:hypothetical protein [Halogranum gelatinilyticum]SDM38868.1 hypothetical protein SAMN04487949_1494 [Halogranum gelatinilyticum]